MASAAHTSVRDLLLARRGIVFLGSTGESPSEEQLCALELELSELGYVLSSRLRACLARSSVKELTSFREWASSVLLAHIGGNRRHEPLFRSFPDGIPDNTRDLWWQKVLVHFLQAEGQPCLFCRRTGTTHVLNPCRHVVCDRCFNGGSYSACPVCEHHVDRSSPFFQLQPERQAPKEQIRFRLLDLGKSEADEAQALFVSLCERKQALSPDDRQALHTIVGEFGSLVLSWLPTTIPVRETIALIFGTLLQEIDPAGMLPFAKRYVTTATDVLRLIAVMSDTDGSLQRETIFKEVSEIEGPSPFWSQIATFLGARLPGPHAKTFTIPIRVHRFKVAKLNRALRRALLSMLEEMNPERLVEDMLRHRSYWVWVGEFLHPHEYADRFPNVARAFLIVRGKAPNSTPAPEFRSWYSRLEEAALVHDLAALLSLLAQRPGELARRFDWLLRLTSNQPEQEVVISAFASHITAFATPVLITLRSHLSTRHAKAAIRVYWPKGRIAKGVSGPDERPPLSRSAIERATIVIDSELLRRFSVKSRFTSCVIDEELRSITAPFNERTSSKSAIQLPRGSRLEVPSGKLVRLFLHWCEPEVGGRTTDLDLSVGFYDTKWNHVGVCSYYQLKAVGKNGQEIARSSGDLRDAPSPDGSTEFVDLDLEQAHSAGVRYAVMVVNAYAGMPFSLLERGFAGLMFRDDPGGQYFDPRTVQLRFSLDGEHGVFLPLVLDIREGILHWLDVHSKGQFEFNNVETSNSAITKICPELMDYFASGARASLFDIGTMHAAARSDHVYVRGQTIAEFERMPGENALAFKVRILSGKADATHSALPPRVGQEPCLAFLFRGDFELASGSDVFALFREQVGPTLSASDLIS
jgi:hypothetical protein